MDHFTPDPPAPVPLAVIPASDLPAPPAAPRGYPLLAWLVIAGCATFVVVRNLLTPAAPGHGLERLTTRAQARYVVGVADLNLPGAAPESLYGQAKSSLNRGSYGQRLRFVAVAGELAGPEEARRLLRELEGEKGDEKPEAAEELAGLLDRLYKARVKGGPEPLAEAERERLVEGLGWFGELALHPPPGDGPESPGRAAVLAPARRTAVAYLSLGGAGILGALAGASLLLLLAVLLFLGKLRGGLFCAGQHGGLYAEAFALYMLVFTGLSFAAGFVGDWIPGGTFRLGLGAAAMFLSLGAVAWPVLRGLPWSQVRREVGLRLGRQPLLEPLYGVGCYLTALPLLLAGLAVMLGLMWLRYWLGWGPEPGDPAGSPSHPIVHVFARRDVWLWVQVAFVACVAAPVVEEVMFRGVLYRHLREATDGLRGRALSVAVSAVVSAFVFAAIHPQGFLGVPVLMALAVPFALAREWRVTLVPSVVAHAINNGAVTLLMILTMS